MLRILPNLITLTNLLCGCLAVLSAFKGNLLWSSYLVGIAAILDFLDGFFARILNAGSELGKQLDSLADMVTFGLVPGVIMLKMLEITRDRYFSSVRMDLSAFLEFDLTNIVLLIAPFALTIFAAIRLAKFNIQGDQNNFFMGLPTPAMAIVVASLPVILLKQIDIGYVALPFDETVVTFHKMARLTAWEHAIASNLLNAKVLLAITAVLSVLMVFPIRLLSMKFSNLSLKQNLGRYCLILGAIILLVIFKVLAIPMVILYYLIVSIIDNNVKKKSFH